MTAVSTKKDAGRQRKPVSTEAKKQQAEMATRPASDAQALPAGSSGKPIPSKFKIAALYLASGPTGFFIPFAQLASKCLLQAAAYRLAMRAAAQRTDSDVLVESDDSSEVAPEGQGRISSETSSRTASSMPTSESEEDKQLASDPDSSETASSMPSSDESEEAPKEARKLVRRHVRTGSQPVQNADAVQDPVTQDL